MRRGHHQPVLQPEVVPGHDHIDIFPHYSQDLPADREVHLENSIEQAGEEPPVRREINKPVLETAQILAGMDKRRRQVQHESAIGLLPEAY